MGESISKRHHDILLSGGRDFGPIRRRSNAWQTATQNSHCDQEGTGTRKKNVHEIFPSTAVADAVAAAETDVRPGADGNDDYGLRPEVANETSHASAPHPKVLISLGASTSTESSSSSPRSSSKSCSRSDGLQMTKINAHHRTDSNA